MQLTEQISERDSGLGWIQFAVMAATTVASAYKKKQDAKKAASKAKKAGNAVAASDAEYTRLQNEARAANSGMFAGVPKSTLYIGGAVLGGGLLLALLSGKKKAIHKRKRKHVSR